MQIDPEILEFLTLKTPREVSHFFGVSHKNFTYYFYRSDPSKRYKKFEISKKNGGSRAIMSPNNSIKFIQEKLSEVMQKYYMQMPKVPCHGFRPKRSIVTNAGPHVRKKYVLNIDLVDFFPTIHFGRVMGMFKSFPFDFNDRVAKTLAQICCHDKKLPQGAPTSPIVSNFICRKLDSELLELAKRHGCTYTRYADDISFSTYRKNFPENFAKIIWAPIKASVEIGSALENRIGENGFKINYRKVRLQSTGMRQEVTGLTVNEFPNVKRKFVRQIRSMLYALTKFGPELAEARHYEIHNKDRSPLKEPPKFVDILKGKIEFLRMVRGANDPLFIKYFNKYVVANTESNLELIDTAEQKLEKSLWVLEGGNFVGTGFYLKGVGLVTCSHVLEDDTKIYQTHKTNNTYEYDVIIKNMDFDIAILNIREFEPANTLELGNSNEVQPKDPLTLYGFPTYSEGNPPTITQGFVTKRKPEHGISRIFIDAKIWDGNSGGPALDARNKVIGIAYKGKGEVENQITPINYIYDAMKGSEKNMLPTNWKEHENNPEIAPRMDEYKKLVKRLRELTLGKDPQPGQKFLPTNEEQKETGQIRIRKDSLYSEIDSWVGSFPKREQSEFDDKESLKVGRESLSMTRIGILIGILIAALAYYYK